MQRAETFHQAERNGFLLFAVFMTVHYPLGFEYFKKNKRHFDF